MAVTSKTYFLYRHIRNDKNHPFYIGIGTINVNDNYKSNLIYNNNERS